MRHPRIVNERAGADQELRERWRGACCWAAGSSRTVTSTGGRLMEGTCSDGCGNVAEQMSSYCRVFEARMVLC